jgi:hypothetical protein
MFFRSTVPPQPTVTEVSSARAAAGDADLEPVVGRSAGDGVAVARDPPDEQSRRVDPCHRAKIGVELTLQIGSTDTTTVSYAPTATAATEIAASTDVQGGGCAFVSGAVS